MGEYVKFCGIETKIGTCEDLYYTSFPKLFQNRYRLSGLSGNLQPLEYLDPKYRWRYRFPFPDEDSLEFGKIVEPFNRNIIVGMPRNFVKDIEHYQIYHSANCQHTYNVNIIIPCPASEEFNNGPFKTSSPDGLSIVPACIAQQGIRNDVLKTICFCGYCGVHFTLDQSDAESICEQLLDQYRHATQWAETIKERILFGYKGMGVFSLVR